MKSVSLTDKEWKVLAWFMDSLDEYYANNCCNDLPNEIKSLWTPEEGNKLAEEFAYINNPNSPEGPSWPISDSCLLNLIQMKIKKQIGI